MRGGGGGRRDAMRQIRVQCQWRAKVDGETMKGGRAEHTRIGRRDNIMGIVNVMKDVAASAVHLEEQATTHQPSGPSQRYAVYHSRVAWANNKRWASTPSTLEHLRRPL
jgi:hypothetical protein